MLKAQYIEKIIQSNNIQMRSIKILTIALALSIIILSKPLKKTKVLTALNCGLKEGSTKPDGDIHYINDQKAVRGSSVDVDYHSDSTASSVDIKYALDKQIYMFQRHTYTEMSYVLPIKTGVHTIILKFAQMYFEKKGQRVFDIKIGKAVVIKDMDVFAKAGGKYAAHEEYIEIEEKEGEVYHNGVLLPNAIDGGKLKITFSKGKADNPIIQAIIMYHGPISQTTYEDYQGLKKSWGSKQELLKAKKQNEKIKELIAITKKKERIIIRNDQLLLQETPKVDQQASKPQKFGPIRSFLMSPIGILIWTAIAIYKLMFLHKRIFKLSNEPKIAVGSHSE